MELKARQVNKGPIGPKGDTGAQGNDGAQGPPGPQGPAGSSGPEVFFNIYASTAQTVSEYLGADDVVHFDSVNALSSVSDFDLTGINTTGSVIFLKHGIYQIEWVTQARATPPIPNPVPSWSFGIWADATLLPGSVYSGYTQAPGDDPAHCTAILQHEIRAGQVMKMRNASVTSVDLNPNVGGSVFPITIATLVVTMLKALP